MATSTYTALRRTSLPALLLCTAAVLTACGDERPGAAGAPTARDDGTATSPGDSPSASTGASPYVEPGVIDGAPHNRENNAYRRPGEMSASGHTDARAEAARMEPVLKRLWKAGKWDPDSVRAELVGKLGYKDLERMSGSAELHGGELRVQAMHGETEDGLTPEGALIGLYVGDDACVTAHIQKSDYEAQANGRFPETGCITPPTGH
ncbi:hypothetical protein [Streptomyces sp. Je 1-369]|uniref:hypothetical protein n=1 Tax=Streptomyces sp. Je 1-369 TaxID=2966192 RepID=UPI002286BA6A|nr:hypothetical protein [Streptomyces sp. Je 1-369]WAL96131.1 hypothetical protein NOO62_17525 [Streptomyces sp. Je 1-369]